MDDMVRYRLQQNALAIEKFRQLPLEEQEWILPLLSKGVRSTLEILDLIASEKLTFEDIGRILGLNPMTVSQKLNTLVQGGMAIDLSETAAYAPIGRPRKLARK